jgi:hypothetical protein
MASAQRIGSYQTFLPLPSMRLDLKTEKVALDESRVESYLNKFFYPLGHESFFADLPGALRRVADIMEKTKA